MHAKAHWIIIFGCSPRCWCDAPKDIDIFRLYLISCVRIVAWLRNYYMYMSISIRISIDSKYKLFCCYDVLYMRSICFHGRDSICLALNLYVYAISNESCHPLTRERKRGRERERAHKMSIISYIPCNMYKYTSPFCANQILLQQHNSRVTIIPIYANEEHCIVHIKIWCNQFQQRNLSFSVDDVYRIFFVFVIFVSVLLSDLYREYWSALPSGKPST